jgi:RNA polymerase sigma-70 factor (ECF subfamily)
MTPPKSDLDLDEIVARFRPVVGFKVRRALGSSNPDWEDVTNEVLAQTIDKVRSGEFRGDSQIGTFIYTIAVRRIVDYIREKTRITRKFPPENDVPSAEEKMETDERIQKLAKAVSSLPQKYREALDLYYYRELSREETARRLGISPARVSERIHYARKLLQKAVREPSAPLSAPPSDSRKD